MINCVCDIPNGGYCKRHGIQKSAHWVVLCTTRPKYFQAWEDGYGPGQNMPRIRVRESINSHIGDIIARRFERIGFHPIPGCPCKDIQNRLNSMTPESVLSDLEGWTRKLRGSARKWKELKGGIWNIIPSPPLWVCRRVLEDACSEARGLLSEEDVTVLEERG
jgi:hypothetical protein